MKWKRLKGKIVSFMLIFALLVTGANLPAGSADAQTADTTSDVEKLVFEFTAAGDDDDHNGLTNDKIVTKLNGEVVDFYGHDGDDMMDENKNSTSSRTFFPMKIANQIVKMKRPVYKVTSLTKGATLKFWDFCWKGLIVDGDTEGAINGATLKDGIFTYYNIKGTDVNKKDYILGETELVFDLSQEYEDGETPEPPAWNGDTFLGFGLDFGASATIEIYDAGEDIEASQLPETTASATKAPSYIPVGEKLVFEFTAAGENDGHDGDTNEGIVTKLNGEVVDFYGHDGDDMMDENKNSTSSRTFFPMEIANEIAKLKRPVFKVTSLTDGATLKFWDFCWEGMWTIGDQTGNINNSYIKDGEFLGTQKRNTVVIDYKLGETEIGIDLSGEYEDGEAPEAPEWNGGTFLGFGLDFGASATIEIYDTAEEEIEPSLLPEQSSTPTPPVATPLLKPSFRPAVISTVAPLQTQAPASTVAPLQTQVPASTVAPLPEQSNIPAGVPGSNVTPGQSSVPSVSTTPVPNGQEKDTVLPDDEDDEEDEEEEESLNPIKKITAPKQIVLKKGKTKTVTVKLRSKNKSMKTTDDVSVTAVSKKVKVSGRKYNSQRLTFRVKGKKKGNTVIYVIIGEKSRKIKVICL
ncbi:cellulosomal scaffoldin anchoring protein C [Clostridium sp. CAG:277]|nr:cellulosomal scaffoldin anchoring protein C [Clostridium sp. CAG:277]